MSNQLPGPYQQRPMPPGYYPPRTNGLAIGAFVTSFVVPILGAILGHVAFSQIKRTGEGGQGLAIAAIIIGWVGTLIYTVFIVLAIMMVVFAFNTFPGVLESFTPTPFPSGF